MKKLKLIDRLKLLFKHNVKKQTTISEQEGNDRINLNIKKFAKFEVADIMIPKTTIIAAPFDMSIKELKQLFYTEEHSRIPIYKDSIDEIEGFIHVKDLFKVIAKTGKVNIATLIRKLIYIPESLKVVELLTQMQREKIHIAIVLDEYGATSGLVTIEDIVELIVGDIDDEYDISEGASYTKIGNNTFIFDAKCSLEEFTSATGVTIELNEDDDFDTLGGFISAKLGYIPKAGEKVKVGETLLEVIAAKPRYVERVKVEVH